MTGAVTALILLGLSPVGASSANISRSYHANSTIPNGSLLSLDPKQSDYVLPANTDNGAHLLGIAVAVNESLLAVDPGSGTIQVATSGTATALVSTVNGSIKVGDQVAVSPFNGIGMKSLSGSHYVGLAQTAFSDSTSGGSVQQVTDKSGKTKKVHVGYLRVSIAIGVNNNSQDSQQLSPLQRLGKSLTGHTVSNLRIILGLLVAIVALLTLITLIYASIYGSIISVGRNPLAKHAIFRTLATVFGMVATTAVTATVLIVFLLR